MNVENNEKIERKNDDLDDDDVDIWEVNLDVGSLFKTVKVPERFAKFKLKSLADLSDDKCLILKEPVDQKTPNKKDEKNKAERNPDEFLPFAVLTIVLMLAKTPERYASNETLPHFLRYMSNR